MSRPPVSIAVLAWNAWPTTRACLDSLRPTLGVRDQVVVVDNGSRDATPVALRGYRWVDVVTNPTNRGFAGGCNDAFRTARHDTVIFLNNDTILAGRWIDPLARALADPSVGAAGPRSNFVSGPQVVPGAGYASAHQMRAFARQWSATHRGQLSDIERLVGFCLAVRRTAFEEIGGFDESYGRGGYEDDDLCRRLRSAGYRLVVCHDSFVHHDGHKTFDANGLDWYAEQESNRDRFHRLHGQSRRPLVSACLITKDEEQNLGACLESLAGFADEVVIYDTGSSDGTVDLGRSMGARVVEGYWDDDFSRARNAALAHCRGQWVAWLDADETLACDDRAGLRRLLARTKPEFDGWSVAIHNLTGAGVGAGFVHHACRLFRRDRCEWVGRLHEQVAVRGDHRGIRQAVLEDASIEHRGYLDEMMRARNKTERNLRVALAEVEAADGWQKGFSLTSLARSLMTAGRWDDAYERAQEALACTDNAITRRLALRTATESLLGLGRLAEALEWCGRLRLECSDGRQADLTEAKVRLAAGEHAEALALLDRVAGGDVDEDGFGLSTAMLASLRAEALAGLGRHSEAADTLTEILLRDGVLDTHVGVIVDSLQRAGRPLAAIASAIPADKAPLFLAQVIQLEPMAADATLEACFATLDDTRSVLAAAATLAKRLPLERALVWSARLRGAGLPSACPLVAVAATDGPPVLRARAAATAVAAFADPRATELFRAAADTASEDDRRIIAAEASQLCPALVAAAG